MTDASPSASSTTDGGARLGEIATPRGNDPHAGLHAGRHGGHRQGPHARPAATPPAPTSCSPTPTTSCCGRAPSASPGWAACTRFMGWDGPILTDSGGFQVMSLAKLAQDHRRGRRLPVPHRRRPHHADARARHRDPGRSAPTSRCSSTSASRCRRRASDIERAVDRSLALGRALPGAPSRDLARRRRQALFGIVQGGTDADLRARIARTRWSAMDFPGYAIGGLAVGETPAGHARHAGADARPRCPPDKPRYLMGVGTPVDLVEAVARGVDMFDCVLPTRSGRARPGLHLGRQGQSQERQARRRSGARSIPPAPARPPRLQPRLPAPPRQVGGVPRAPCCSPGPTSPSTRS